MGSDSFANNQWKIFFSLMCDRNTWKALYISTSVVNERVSLWNHLFMDIMKIEAHLNDVYLLLVYCSHGVYKSIMIIFLWVSLILLINQENIKSNSKASLGNGLAIQKAMEMRSEKTRIAQDFLDGNNTWRKKITAGFQVDATGHWQTSPTCCLPSLPQVCSRSFPWLWIWPAL